MAEPDLKRAKTDKMAEVRVALRAAERAEWIGHTSEIRYLEQQTETIRREDPIDKDTELDLIIAQLNQKAARERQGAALHANSTEGFTCCICMDRSPLSKLRLLIPCGHGFCEVCMRKVHVQPLCPTCRKTIDNVLRPYL